MVDPLVTPDRILEAAEDVLRRFGLSKANVVDVARALGVSHGSIYRHFGSKTVLIEAVVGRWLGRLSGPLALIAAEDGPAVERLQRWFDVLITLRRRKVDDDPELFAAYLFVASQPNQAALMEIERLKNHVAKIIDDGIRQTAFGPMDANRAASAILCAALKFHHPAHAGEWKRTNVDEEFDAVWRLILRSLGVRMITL